LEPLQPPDAVQLVAFVEVHVKVDLLPLTTPVGSALSAMVGGGADSTDTVTRRLALPPVPVQLSVKLVRVVNGPVLCVPLVGSGPVQPCEAVQVVAFVEVQLRIAAVPLATLAGLALRVTVGAGTTVTWAV
jgi:hypothetical protein